MHRESKAEINFAEPLLHEKNDEEINCKGKCVSKVLKNPLEFLSYTYKVQTAYAP